MHYGSENSLWADQRAIPPFWVVFSKKSLSWASSISARMSYPRDTSACPSSWGLFWGHWSMRRAPLGHRTCSKRCDKLIHKLMIVINLIDKFCRECPDHALQTDRETQTLSAALLSRDSCLSPVSSFSKLSPKSGGWRGQVFGAEGRAPRGVFSSVYTQGRQGQSCSCPKWGPANGGHDRGHSYDLILGP